MAPVLARSRGVRPRSSEERRRTSAPGPGRSLRRHPALGADVVARFAAYGAVHRLVRHHDQRWDGAGYPDGLAGEAIPVGARVLAVADAYDAMTTMRSYRPARSHEATLKVLEEGAGSQWDAEVVRVAVAYLRETTPVPAATLAPAPAVAA